MFKNLWGFIPTPLRTGRVKKLLNGKATGIDGIPNKALKDSAELIASSLSDSFNFSVGTKPIQMILKLLRLPSFLSLVIKMM